MFIIEPRIYTHYKSVVCWDIIYKRQFKNIMELPLFLQCALNSSSAQTVKEKARGLSAHIALEIVSGFKSVSTRSGQCATTFQLKKGSLLGCVVNLRGASLYFFLDQYINTACSFIAVPRGNYQRSNCVDIRYNVGGRDFAPFFGLETHLSLLSSRRGFNCTLSTCSAFSGEFMLLCTAMQVPV